MGFVRRVLLSAYEDNVAFLASALTFDALVAAVPLALLALAAIGLLAQAQDDALHGLRNLLETFIPERTGGPTPRAAAERLLEGLAARSAGLSALGLPLFLWFSTRFFGGARAALNDVFDTEESRPWLVQKGLDLFMVVVTLALLILNAAATVLLGDSTWLARFVGGLLAFGLGVALFALIYTLAPARRVARDTALVAALVAALAFEAAKVLYGAYLTRFATLDRLISNTNVLALVLLVVWIYYTALAFLVGGEVAETYDLMRRQREQRAMLT
ncbi:MAG TPA: YhjD/YihY/BrkB family envelope integrity protein [Gemmatimonadales bacterium]|nr:YhjD/YihY/BrkB family envelope integrity protein [Gemmatimonadales bacterium]